MGFDPLSAVADVVGKVIDRVIPDPAQKAAAQLEVLKMVQTGDLAELSATTAAAHDQNLVNLAEAQNPNLFVAGWRPACGWVCAIGLLYTFLLYPILNGLGLHAPATDTTQLVELLGGMLGLGAMRMKEKLSGVAGNIGHG